MSVLTLYLNRQVLLGSLAFGGVLLLLSLVGLLAQYLRAAANGEVVAALIPALVALSLPHNLSLILPLSFFAALVLALGRMSAARELDVLRACSLSNWQLALLLLPTLLLLTALLASLQHYWLPAAMTKFERLHNERDGRDLLEQLVSGKALRLSDNAMIYAQGRGAEGVFQNLLVISPSVDGWQVILTPTAERHWSERFQAKYLRLQTPNYYQLEPEGWLQRHESEQAYWAIPEQVRPFSLDRLEAKATSALWNSSAAEDHAQLQWRFSALLTMPLLFLLGLQLGCLAPRQGRFVAIPKALLVYLLYSVAQYGCYQALLQGSIAPFPGLLWPHLAALLLYGVTLVARRQR